MSSFYAPSSLSSCRQFVMLLCPYAVSVSCCPLYVMLLSSVCHTAALNESCLSSVLCSPQGVLSAVCHVVLDVCSCPQCVMLSFFCLFVVPSVSCCPQCVLLFTVCHVVLHVSCCYLQFGMFSSVCPVVLSVVLLS